MDYGLDLDYDFNPSGPTGYRSSIGYTVNSRLYIEVEGTCIIRYNGRNINVLKALW